MSEKQRHYIISILLLSGFITILNQNLLNTALPNIMASLNISESTAQWLATGFLLVNGVMIPVTASLIEKYTTRFLFMSSMIIFTLGSILAAVSQSFTLLFIARLIQAFGAGVMMPLMQTILFLIFPPEKRGYAMGLAGLVIGFAPAVGPTLSGYLVAKYSWQTPFEVVVVGCIALLIFGYYKLTNVNEGKELTIDRKSIITSTLGFGGILYTFSTAGDYGWSSLHTLVGLIIGSISLIYFYYRQKRLSTPFLNFEVFKYPVFTLATIIGMLSMISLMSVALLLPMYVQGVLQYSPLKSGLLLLPGAIIIAILSLVTGKIFDIYGAKWITVFGFVIIAISTFCLTYLKLDTGFYYLLAIYTCRMIGISMTNTSPMTAGLNTLPKYLIPHGNAMLGTLRTLAASIGTALLVTVMSTFRSNYIPNSSAFQNMDKSSALAMINKQAAVYGFNKAFLIAAIIAIVGMIISLWLPKK